MLAQNLSDHIGAVLVQMPKMLSSALALPADDDPVSFERA